MKTGGAALSPAAVSLARRVGRGLFVPGLACFTVASHWPRISFAGPEAAPGLVLDKLVHVVGFAVLAALLAAAVWPRDGDVSRAAKRCLLVGIALAGWGFIDESTQLLVGREMTAGDLVADATGAALGAGWCLWLGRRWGRLAAEAAPKPKPKLESTLPLEAAPEPAGEAGPDAGADAEFEATVRTPVRTLVRTPGLLHSASVVSALTTVSRVTGLARDAVLAGFFGAGLLLDAFFVAFLVPNLFRRLFGEGALTAAFLPRYRRLLDDDPAEAARYAVAVLREAALWLVGAVLLAEAVVLGALFAGVGGEKARLGLTLTATMLPYAPLVCGTALLGAIGQARHRFGPAAAAPVLLNLGMIVAAALAAVATGDGATRVLLVSSSVVALGAMQLAMVRAGIGPIRTPGAATSPAAAAAAPGSAKSLAQAASEASASALSASLSATRRAMLPMLLGLGVFQVNTLLDGLLAFGLSAPADAPDELLRFAGLEMAHPLRSGSVTTLTLAQRLYQFPLGVFGIALATAIFPRLAATARDPAAFSRMLRRGLWLSLAIGLPASFGLLAIRLPLARVVFERGAFDAADAAAVAHILTGYASAVWAYMLMHLWTRAFYAHDDASTPLKVAVAAVGLNLALNLTLVWPLGAAGMAWATAISAAAQAGVLALILRRRGWLASPADATDATDTTEAGLPRRLPLALFAGTAAMAATLAGLNALSPAETLASTGLLAQLVLLVIVGAAVYGTVLLAILRAPRASA